MTRRTIELEIVKIDSKSSKTILDVIQTLAFYSEHRWYGIGEDYGLIVDGDASLNFDFERCYSIYLKTSACFKSEEEIVWNNYEKDIKHLSKKISAVRVLLSRRFIRYRIFGRSDLCSRFLLLPQRQCCS